MVSATAIAPGTRRIEGLKIERFSEGDILCLRFTGVIDEGFEGRKVANGLTGQRLVVDLSNVVRVSSFGIREWLEFVGTAKKRTRSMFLISIAPKVMNQLNMVADFVGQSKVFSFLAPYHCDYCDADRVRLLNMDRDRESIVQLVAPERSCEGCGNALEFDDDPVSYFSYVAKQEDFDLDPDIANFLISKLNYSISDLSRRMHTEKILESHCTYIRLTGNLDAAFPATKLAEGLEGSVVIDVGGIAGIEPEGAAEFRKFISLAKATAELVALRDCGTTFMEKVLRSETIDGKLMVLSFTMPYSCPSCSSSSAHLLDVEEHHGLLRIGRAPTRKCANCGAASIAAPSNALSTLLPRLGKPEIGRSLRKSMERASRKKPTKTKTKTESISTLSLVIMILVMSAALAAVVAFQSWKTDSAVQAAITQVQDTRRPAWISSTTTLSSYCANVGRRTHCVGVSSFLKSKSAARLEASNAALEALANIIGLRIDNPVFRSSVLPIYKDIRQLALRDLDEALNDPSKRGLDRAMRIVRQGYRTVAEALRATGPGIPAQVSDWYWEEYETVDGKATEFKAFVRYDLSDDQLEALEAEFGHTTTVLGATVITAFPSIAWRHPETAIGAIVTKMAPGVLGETTLQAGDVILSTAGERIRSVGDFERLMLAEYGSRKSRNGHLRFSFRIEEGLVVRHDGVPGSKPIVMSESTP